MYTYGRFQKTSRFCLIPKSIIDYHLLCGKGLSHQYQEGRSSILSFSRGVATWREILNIPGIEKTMYQSMNSSIRRVYPLRLWVHQPWSFHLQYGLLVHQWSTHIEPNYSTTTLPWSWWINEDIKYISVWLPCLIQTEKCALSDSFSSCSCSIRRSNEETCFANFSRSRSKSSCVGPFSLSIIILRMMSFTWWSWSLYESRSFSSDWISSWH